MANKLILTRLKHLETFVSPPSDNLNGFPIKQEPGFRYKIESRELIVYDIGGEYIRTCVKKIDGLTGQVISRTYYHQPTPSHN